MAYIIKAGDQKISLDDQINPFIELDWKNAAKYDFSQFTEIERKNIFLIGFPLENTNRFLNWFRFKFSLLLIKDKITNFSGIEIFKAKYKRRIQPTDTIIQKVIEKKDHYQYVLIDPAGLDPYSISLLKNFIRSLNDLPQKVFLIDIINQPKLDFKFND